MAKLVACVGGVVLDRVLLVDALPSGPSKSVARGYVERGGGMAATAAAAIAALGGEAELWARVGDDATGHAVLAEIARAGVSRAHVIVAPGGLTATSVVHIDPSGERMLTNFRGSLPDAPEPLPLHRVASLDALLADVRWPSGAAAALAEARRRGIPTVLDADGGDGEALRRLVPLADHAIFSRQGLRELVGVDAAETALREAARIAPPDAVLGVTHGEDGSHWLIGGRHHHVAAVPVEAVNSNGVGDVFHGGYALAIAEGRTPLDAARFAAAAAAAKCRDPRGWDGMPGRAAVDALRAVPDRTEPIEASLPAR